MISILSFVLCGRSNFNIYRKPQLYTHHTPCMSLFCSISGQNINLTKSKAIFSNYCDITTRDLVQRLFSITPTTSFGKYLGIPILNQKSKASDFLYIIDNMRKKLASWKVNFLTIASRLTLAKSTINVIPAYAMQYFHLP